MSSIVWAMILIIPVALLLRVLIVALTGQKEEGAVRSRERAEREERAAAGHTTAETTAPENIRDYTAHDVDRSRGR